ncbi:transcriptional regulator TACO1-like protein [Podospora aff. communis PSN243]|uniref:Transcriptional regulator TACO1-like protein n=1 Tax=Podospora aff. communis PSN243 TaxID=3040156 RepID=A0AAV9H801_9PEZI|nr:transcriptional regulator TACO1-like protein [Podospora aff. communis PSN243]
MATISCGLRPLQRLPICAQCRRSFFTVPALQSGHNKWSKIRHDKAVKDGQKAKVRSELAKLITLYSKLYGPDINQNPQLATAITLAKKQQLPKDKIEGAISRGQGRSLAGKVLESITFEIISPPNVALILDVETDNRNRAIAEIKDIVSTGGAAVSGSKFYFTRVGRVVFEKGGNGSGVDDIMDDAIEAGAEDIENDADGNLVIWTQPTMTSQICETLSSKRGLKVLSSGIIWNPNPESEAKVDSSLELPQLTKMLAALSEYPDVQAVYSNISRGSLSDDEWADIANNVDVGIGI